MIVNMIESRRPVSSKGYGSTQSSTKPLQVIRLGNIYQLLDQINSDIGFWVLLNFLLVNLVLLLLPK